MLNTPIVFIIFNRPETTQRVFETIRAARPRRLLVVADGPRADREGEAERCAAARAIIEEIDWPCEVSRNYSETNLGCRRRISSGIDWAFEQVEEAIILEDDTLPDPSFFRYCSELLEYYRDDERVMVISGDNFQDGIQRGNGSYYFSKYMHCWGWASWRRAWRHYDVEMRHWPEFANSATFRDLCPDEYERTFWFNILDRAERGKIDAWTYAWMFACWRRNGLTALPNVNLVSNIGFNADATRTTDTDDPLNNLPIGELGSIRHPSEVAPNMPADQYTFANIFNPSISAPPMNEQINEHNRRRIGITTQCRDCEEIPKIAGAGTVRDGVQLMHNGVKVEEDCYYGAWMTELIRQLQGHHEPQEERAFYEVARRIPSGGTMIELGSYWAYYSLWFQRQIPGARTYMLEPDTDNLKVGQRNFALNHAEGQFFNYAIGRVSNPNTEFQCEGSGRTLTIPTISVDDFLAQQEIDHVDLLLSDVQGFEFDMLRGAKRSISRGAIRFMIVSTHHHTFSGDPLTHRHCVNWLRKQGAAILAEHSVSESFSGDGLVVASFDPADRDMPEIPLTRNWSSNGLFRELEFDLAEAWAAMRPAEATPTQAEANSGKSARMHRAEPGPECHLASRPILSRLGSRARRMFGL